MKRFLKYLLLPFLAFPLLVQAANTVSSYPPVTSAGPNDLFYIVTSPINSLSDHNITFSNLSASVYSGIGGNLTINTSGLATIGNGQVTNSMLAGSINATKILPGTVNNTVFGYLANVTSDIQAQFNAITAGYVTSVSNSDSSITFSPTTGAVVGSLNPAHANTWTALQSFTLGANVSSGQAYEYNGQSAIIAQTALFNYYFAGAGNLTGSGVGNYALGGTALTSITGGQFNTAMGYQALLNNTTGSNNSGFGFQALAGLSSGSDNNGIGYLAGYKITGGSATNSTGSNSLFLGNLTRANANGDTNEIVIGDSTTGNGSNTATIGNSSITQNFLNGTITLPYNVGIADPLANGTWMLRDTNGNGLSSNAGGNDGITIWNDNLAASNSTFFETIIPNAAVLGWSASITAANATTGFSRTGDGIIAVGNGTATDHSGTLNLAGIYISPDLTSGFKARGSTGNFDLYISGVPSIDYGLPGAKPIASHSSDFTIGWATGDPTLTASDTALSRISAGVLGLGDGTQGDYTGTLKASGLILDGINTSGVTQMATIDNAGNVGSQTIPSGGGITIGGAITSGTANRVLFEDGSNNLEEDADFDFTSGTSFNVGFSGSSRLLISPNQSIIGNPSTGVGADFNSGSDVVRINTTASGYMQFGQTVSTNPDPGLLYVFPSGSGLTLSDNATTAYFNLSIAGTGVFHASKNSGTVEIGGGIITIDFINNLVKITNVPSYANDAAATGAGLTTGQLYETTTLGITALNIVP